MEGDRPTAAMAIAALADGDGEDDGEDDGFLSMEKLEEG